MSQPVCHLSGDFTKDTWSDLLELFSEDTFLMKWEIDRKEVASASFEKLRRVRVPYWQGGTETYSGVPCVNPGGHLGHVPRFRALHETLGAIPQS